MPKVARRVLTVLALVVCLGISQQARAISYEDSLDNCSYPKVLDVMVLRPLAMASIVVGAGLFAVIAPISVFTVWDEIDQVAMDLIISPARFTFRRPLGECSGAMGAY